MIKRKANLAKGADLEVLRRLEKKIAFKIPPIFPYPRGHPAGAVFAQFGYLANDAGQIIGLALPPRQKGLRSIKELPTEILELRHLHSLDLRGSRIEVLPRELFELGLNPCPIAVSGHSESAEIALARVPVRVPPPEVLARGREAVLDYFNQLEESGVDHLYEAKLLIVGEGGAGKTSLAFKIQDPDAGLPLQDDTTQGIAVATWHFPLANGAQFRVNIWDFGGQEIYHHTHQFFLTRRSLYALVHDTRDEKTDFNYWLNAVELLSGNSPLLVVNNERADRKARYSQERLRSRYGNLREFLDTNLGTGRGVDKVVSAIRSYIERLDHVGAALPRTWVEVRRALESANQDYISEDEFLRVCDRHGFKNRKDALQLSGYLHDLGVCLHFQRDSVLKHTVILRPEWGTKAVYRLLDDDILVNNHGRFSRADIERVWADKYAGKHDELLRLIENFKICYRIPGREEYIAPQWLRPERPVYDWPGVNELKLRYHYEFMPKGVLNQLIVNMHQLIPNQELVWRNGVVLEKDGTRAEVIGDEQARTVRIRVEGRSSKSLLDIVTNQLEQYHESLSNLQVQKLVPCNCTTCRGADEPHFFNFESLKRRVEARVFEVECDTSFDRVNIIELLDDVIARARLLTSNGAIELSSLQPAEFPEKAVFLSYAWGGESERVADAVDNAFERRGVSIIRDKHALGYKGRIRGFMEKLGRGRAVVVIISDRYLRSESCMFELLRIFEAGDVVDRIFPLVLDDAKIYRAADRIKYVKHWEDEFAALDKGLREISAAYTSALREDIDIHAEIRRALPKLASILSDLNARTVKDHEEEGFRTLLNDVGSAIDS